MISLIGIRESDFLLFQRDILAIERSSFPSPWSLTSFKEEVMSPISHLWVLLADRMVAGYICFWMFAGEIHLMNIAVHGERRKRGLGRLLLIKMIKVGQANKVQGVWLEVRPSNLIARDLYQKVGFMETGRRPRYYSDTGEDAIVMSLSMPERDMGL